MTDEVTTGEDSEDSAPVSASADDAIDIRALENEGEVAADYLEEFLDITDIDGDIDIDVENGRASVAIVTDDVGGSRTLRRLVGREGEVLEALQELTRLAVHTKTGDRSRLMLDVDSFRARRRKELTSLARSVIEEVKEKGAAVALEPMNPFERKVIHDAVAAAGLRSASEGVESERYVIIQNA